MLMDVKSFFSSAHDWYYLSGIPIGFALYVAATGAAFQFEVRRLPKTGSINRGVLIGRIDRTKNVILLAFAIISSGVIYWCAANAIKQPVHWWAVIGIPCVIAVGATGMLSVSSRFRGVPGQRNWLQRALVFIDPATVDGNAWFGLTVFVVLQAYFFSLHMSEFVLDSFKYLETLTRLHISN